MKPKLIRGVHYIPSWVSEDRLGDRPERPARAEEAPKRIRPNREEADIPYVPRIAEAVQKAFDTTHRRAVVIAILFENMGQVVPHEKLGTSIEAANCAVSNVRYFLPEGSIINEKGRGYALSPAGIRLVTEKLGALNV